METEKGETVKAAHSPKSLPEARGFQEVIKNVPNPAGNQWECDY